MSDMLFDMPDPPQKPVPKVDKVSEDRRRTERQQQAIRAGYHPLCFVVNTLRLHPSANRDARKDDPRGEPFTCGSCVHRILVSHHDKTYPKCDRVNTASAASDCRAWWPGCVAWQSREES